MEVVRIEVGQLKANCYLLIDEATSSCLVIDPGDDADYIQRIIVDNDVTPKAIVATHAHFDHIMAVNEMKLAYNVPFLMHSQDAFLLSRMQSSAKHFTGVDPGPTPTIDVELKTGRLVIHTWDMRVIATPGHTPGSVSLHLPKERCVFVGDLVFAGGYVGRTDFKYSLDDYLHESIQKILELPDETTVYPGHGEETSVGQIRAYFS